MIMEGEMPTESNPNENWPIKCTTISGIQRHRNKIIEGLVQNTF